MSSNIEKNIMDNILIYLHEVLQRPHQGLKKISELIVRRIKKKKNVRRIQQKKCISREDITKFSMTVPSLKKETHTNIFYLRERNSGPSVVLCVSNTCIHGKALIHFS